MRFTIENDTLAKILKILGLESDEIKSQLPFPEPSVHNQTEDFKILILVRGIVDKFSSKPRTSQKRIINSTSTQQLQEHLQSQSSSNFSPEFQDLEKSLQGNQFLVSLFQASKKIQISLKIPDCIILSNFNEPIRMWTNTQGLVQNRFFLINDLKSELFSFKKNIFSNFSSFVLRCEHHTSTKILYQTYFYEFDEISELVDKINEVSYLKTPVVISEFIKFKGNLPTKSRGVFNGASGKIFFVAAKEKLNQKKKVNYSWVNKFIPYQLLETLQLSIQELEFFESGFKCKVVFPAINKPISFEKSVFELEFLKFAEKILSLLKFIIKTATKLQTFQKHKEKLSLFLSYLNTKLEKLENFSQRFSRRSISQTNIKKQWEANQYIKLSESICTVYQITSSKRLSSYFTVYSEVIKLLKSQIPKTVQISSCVIDFIDSNEGIFLIKLLKVTFVEKILKKLPTIQSTKHISLFSATEGSGFVKGKMNRQRLCCGDYCSLLKRNDFETKAKIEFLMKYHLEYSAALFELLKLQDLFNMDTVNHLLSRHKRSFTPITENMQYKVLRKVILEDRYDKYSLRSLIVNLPSEVVRELNLILQSGNESGIGINISQEGFGDMNKGKKLNWEFELVPVCDMCYKIYSKRIKG